MTIVVQDILYVRGKGKYHGFDKINYEEIDFATANEHKAIKAMLNFGIYPLAYHLNSSYGIMIYKLLYTNKIFYFIIKVNHNNNDLTYLVDSNKNLIHYD